MSLLQDKSSIVIVGTGMAGYELAKAFRALDNSTPLVLVTQDRGDSYVKPILSNALFRNKTPETIVAQTAAEMAESLGAEIVTRSEVISLDRQDQSLCLQTGQTISYHRLVFACGARPNALPWKEQVRGAVCSVNHLEDYEDFLAKIAGKQRIAIVGDGFVGCEFANDLAGAGYKIDVVTTGAYPLHRLVPPSIGAVLREALEAQGVGWHVSAKAKTVDAHPSALYRLVLETGEPLETEYILSAIGLTPNINLARSAGLDTNRGIAVDEYLNTSDPHIYALGDCAEVKGHNLYFVAPLRRCAAALAHTLAGKKTPVSYPAMSVSLKTPACPIALYPAPKGVQGSWQITGGEGDVQALYYDHQKQLRGFALTGTYFKKRTELTTALPPLFV